MMQSLRGKLMVSHVLPTLLLLPLLSLYLLYSLETFYTQSLLQQLVTQAQLLRNEVERNPELVANGVTAQTFLDTVAPMTASRVVLLDRDATIVASTRKEDTDRIGTHFEPPAVQQALSGGLAKGLGPGFTTDVAYVVLPLREATKTTGALRLSYEVDDVRAQFDQLRWLIVVGIILTVGLALGLAWLLSATIARPLRELTFRAHTIAGGDYRARVAIHSHDEVGALANSFNQMTERLEHAEKMRDRQLAAIAHELARPLTGMRAGLDTLQEDRDIDAEMRDMVLGGLGDELDRLERLIGTLRGLHKRALNPIQLHRIPIAPQDIIRACVSNFEPAAEHAGVTLQTDVPTGLAPVLADQDRLIQVLTNLLDNALKFTPRGGRITVQAGSDGPTVWIRITDTGVGIAPEELPNLFQQFYRGADSRPPEKRGMGLGLAICREIIIAHGGRIAVESAPGKGAQFTFTLPKA